MITYGIMILVILLALSLPPFANGAISANLNFIRGERYTTLAKKIQPLPTDTLSSSFKPMGVFGNILDGLTNTTRDLLISRAHSRPELVCTLLLLLLLLFIPSISHKSLTLTFCIHTF
jgi:hypothetical protein